MSPLNACALVARSATETACIQCGEQGTCSASSSAACFAATAFLACQTRTSCRTAEPGEGQPPPRFGGVRKGRKISPRDYGRVERASKFGPRNGAGVQVRGAKRDGDARWRRASGKGCKTECCSPPQAATLHAGVRHVIIKVEAHGGPLRCTAGTGRREGSLRMWFVSHA